MNRIKEHMNNDLLQHTIRSICDIGSIMWDRGWAEANAGNISIDVTADITIERCQITSCARVDTTISYPVCAGRNYLVTAAGSRLRELSHVSKNDILLIHVLPALDGYVIVQGGQEAQATSELATHLAIHAYLCENNRSERAVLHSHPTHLTAVTHIDQYCDEIALARLLTSLHPEISIALPEGIGFVAYQCPGTDKLAADTIISLRKHRVIVWEKHGCITVGDTVEQAFDHTDIVNKAAEIYFLSKSSGHEIQGLSEKQLSELKGTGNSKWYTNKGKIR